MADSDQIFEVSTPSGHVLHIQAKDEQAALAGAQDWHEKNSSLWQSIKDIPSGLGYGFSKGLSGYGSALGQATAHEMGQPELAAEIPSGAKTFEQIQKNITGPLQGPTSIGGE